MNPSKKGKGPGNNGKTKSQLRQELAETQKALRNQETQSIECQEELLHTSNELRALERKLQEKVSLAEAQSEKLREIQEKNAELRKRLQATEEKAPIQLNEAKRKLQASEQERAQLEEKIRGLEKTMDSLKEAVVASEEREEALSHKVRTPKASFRIDLYPYQGHYQGRIVNLLSTEDRKLFADLDQEAIIKFISSRLPEMEEGVEKTEPAPVQKIPPATKVAEPPPKEVPEAKGTSGHVPRLEELKIIPVGAASPSNVLPHGQPFEVCINLNFEECLLPAEAPVEQTVKIYAKTMGGGPRQIVGEKRGLLTPPEESSVKMSAKALPAGTYRLEASLIFRGPTGVPVPSGSFLRGSLFHVC